MLTSFKNRFLHSACVLSFRRWLYSQHLLPPLLHAHRIEPLACEDDLLRRLPIGAFAYEVNCSPRHATSPSSTCVGLIRIPARICTNGWPASRTSNYTATFGENASYDLPQLSFHLVESASLPIPPATPPPAAVPPAAEPVTCRPCRSSGKRRS